MCPVCLSVLTFTTGHSLGAGAAALLARLLRPAHPGVQCFAFSPPGETVAPPARPSVSLGEGRDYVGVSVRGGVEECDAY